MSVGDDPRFERALRRASWLNTLGIAPKLLMPVYLVAITRLLGRDEVGIYLLGLAFQELVAGVVVNGFADALIVRASAALEQSGTSAKNAAAVVAGALVLSLGAALGIVALELLAGGHVVARWLPAYVGLHPGLHLLALSIVPRAFTQMSVASLRAALEPEWDVLVNDVLYPVLLLTGTFVATRFERDVGSVFTVHLVVELACAAVVSAPLTRVYGGRALVAAASRSRPERELLAFALPQAVNLTIARYLSRLDALLLAHYGLPSGELARFSTAALVTSNLSQVRLVLARALAPVIARLSALGALASLERTFGDVVRRALFVAGAVALGFVPLRDDLMRLVHPDYAGDSRFVLVLLAGSFVATTYGLASSFLAFMGHVRASLWNGVVACVLNTAFLAWAVPRWGLLGAAFGTSLAVILQTVALHVELRALATIRMPWRPLVAPHVAIGLVAGAFALLGDPARLVGPLRVASSLAGVVVFVVAATLDRAWFARPTCEPSDPPSDARATVQASSGRPSSSSKSRS